jgi:prepilin-type N-terminal cleavage/methylation domain-containing protein
MFKRAFTLIELLVVISVITLLMALLMPALTRARLSARVLVVNAELSNICLGLEGYSLDNNNQYPPTRADCNPNARKHVYALPAELVTSSYLPAGQQGKIKFAAMEDEFFHGYAYKYIAVGDLYDYRGTPMGKQSFYLPDNYPQNELGLLTKYNNRQNSPVSWVVFSVGPGFNKDSLEQKTFPIKDGYPFLNKFLYTNKTNKGVISRMRLKNGTITSGMLQR